MNLIKHEKKSGGEDFVAQAPVRVSKAFIYGGSVIVPDVLSSEHIYSHGGYGYFMSDRQDRVNRLLFPGEPSSGTELPTLSEAGHNWSEKSPLYERLYLSPEETVYLSLDMKLLEVSENKRDLTPVIYRGSPSSHHAAAGVKIETQMEPRFFVGMNRVLTNMKKALVVMTPIVPDGLNTSSQQCADSVHISV
ncbi:hypothetical protein OESDEN_03502 [Oesophagostomum dentatum]|uniref:tRNA intron endonuclease N-terminal domain-containing protein n=1 Tax=Oesophagostomum dentatum TaxID=61180 RepID=A0A0B1TG61_OESDE|nr:hypothetical protein OESDEN_03502 [Oesophagostomum dentatum]